MLAVDALAGTVEADPSDDVAAGFARRAELAARLADWAYYGAPDDPAAIAGALAGLGGATILVTYSGEFSGSVAGMGFLALAALIFGQWKPLGVLGATFFFGFAATLANASQAEPALQAIPEVILKVFPYVVTLLALIFFSKSTQAPRAAGEPFEKGKR